MIYLRAPCLTQQKSGRVTTVDAGPAVPPHGY